MKRIDLIPNFDRCFFWRPNNNSNLTNLCLYYQSVYCLLTNGSPNFLDIVWQETSRQPVQHPTPAQTKLKIHQLKDLLEDKEGLPVPLELCHLYHHVCLVHDVREGKLERQVQETYNFTFIPSNLSNLCQVLSASPLCFCKWLFFKTRRERASLNDSLKHSFSEHLILN